LIHVALDYEILPKSLAIPPFVENNLLIVENIYFSKYLSRLILRWHFGVSELEALVLGITKILIPNYLSVNFFISLSKSEIKLRS